MVRVHCDRCEALVDDYPTWVEESQTIWYIVIHSSGQVPCPEKDLCRRCRIEVLEAYYQALKMLKAPTGGHLMDCRWDDSSRRYVCVDGCEIKLLNESGNRI